MDNPETRVSNAVSDTGVLERVSRKAKANKSLTAALSIVVCIVIVAVAMALTDSEDSTVMVLILFVLTTIGLFCTLGVIFDALDDK